MLSQPNLQVSSIPTQTNPIAGGDTGAQRALEAKEQFLKMLVAQISNQSPTNPMDDKDMVSQLAQFSSIEQAIETNAKLDALEHAQMTSTKLSVAQLIGKQAAASTGTVNVGQDGIVSPIAFELESRAKDVTVHVVDASDKLVRSIDLRDQGAGAHSVPWDGKGIDKLPLPPGRYRVQVEAADQNHAEVAVRHEIRGTIRRVDVEGNEPAVYINDRRVALREISQIAE
jgi:flagellar basal-body rod modification protein FlgD